MVKISLPSPNDFNGSGENKAQDIKHFLKQLELSVHHAQKAFEEMEKDGMITEDSYVTFNHPKMNLYEREQDENSYVKVHVDEEADQMNQIEIEIN